MLGMIRKYVKPFPRVVGKALAVLPLTPNQFTFLSVILAGISVYFLANKSYLIGAVFVGMAMLIDFLDGSFAEAKGQKTYFGNYFDAMMDKAVEVIIYIGIAFTHPILSITAISTTMLLSYAKPRVALVIETDNHDWPGIGERPDRLLILLVGLVVVHFLQKEPYVSIDALRIVLIIVIVITFIGFLQRMVYARKLIDKAAKTGKILPYLRKK
ncbi:MAG: CDP-alcohol phosphatidyltransferase family protein [archaeon]